MDIQKLRTRIEIFLTNHPDIENFKIGKTSDLEERDDDYYEDGYNYVHKLYCGEKDEIIEAEKQLISYFTCVSQYKNKCDNEQVGGGSPDATTLYIALKMKDVSVQHLNEFEIFNEYFADENNNE